MPKYVLDKKGFLKGMSISEEMGGFFRDTQGINLYSPTEIGVLQSNNNQTTVYSEGSATALTSPVTQLVQYGTSDGEFVLALSNDHAVRMSIDGSDSESTAVVAFSGSNNADKRGASVYHLGSACSFNIGVFYSLDTDIGVYDARGGSPQGLFNESEFDADFMSTLPANNSTISSATYRAMYWHKRQDILYWNSSSTGAQNNTVDSYDANTGTMGTLTEGALDLPEDWEIKDFAHLRDYLAILAVNPIGDGNSNYQHITRRSKIFFWDGVSDSWNYETPEISDEIIRLVNTEEGLFGIGKGDGVSYYQFELEQAKKIFNWSGSGTPVDITAGRRDGNDIANYGAVTASGNQIFFLGKDGDNAHIMSLNERFNVGLRKKVTKDYILKCPQNSGVVDLGDLVAVTPRKFYASFHDDDGANADQYRVVRVSPALQPTDDARIDTVELDAYFGGDGLSKEMESIVFHVQPLASGDVLEVYKELNYAGSWTRLDGGASAAATNSIRESDFSGNNETQVKFTRSDMFRNLRLRFDWTGGNVKIRKVVVNWKYADSE